MTIQPSTRRLPIPFVECGTCPRYRSLAGCPLRKYLSPCFVLQLEVKHDAEEADRWAKYVDSTLGK